MPNTLTNMPKNGKFFNIIHRIQLVTRYPDFKPRFPDNTASHSFRVALVSFLLAKSEIEKYGAVLDVEKIVCRAIFHDFNDVVTGSIKYRTKKDPRIAPRIEKMEHTASAQIAGYVSDFLKEDFTDFLVNAEDASPEGEIIRLADTLDVILFSTREIEAGNTFYFPEAYKESVEKIRSSGHRSANDLLDVLLDEKDPYREFIMAILKFDQIDRWSLKYNLHKDEDAMHTFRMAAEAIYFALYEKRKFGTEINILTLVCKILFHDLEEAITGDFQSTVKHQDEETRKDFARYGREVAIQMVESTPSYLHQDLYFYFVNAKDETPEGIMVAVCDKIDALVKSLLESRINEIEYKMEYGKQLKIIQMKYFKYEYVKFFTGIIIHDLMNPWFDDYLF